MYSLSRSLWLYSCCSQFLQAGKTTFSAPPCRLADGVFHVMLVRATVSRYRLARILLALETGTHVDMPGVEWIECTQYSLEPADATASFNDLDGEAIERGPVQGACVSSCI